MAEPRRSQRLKRPAPIDSAPPTTVTGATTVSKTKKRKTAHDDSPAPAPKPVKRRGSLAGFMQMPPDILYEVLMNLEPLDLIRVSRVSKYLRSVLLSRSSRVVWLKSLASVEDLPPQPDDLSDVQYAVLMFDPTCSFCGCSNVNSAIVPLRARCCGPCFSSRRNFIPGHALKSMLSERFEKLADPLLRPIAGLNKKFKGIYYLMSEVREITNMFKTSLHKVEAMEAYKKKREEIVAVFQERKREAGCLENWLEGRRLSHQESLEAIRNQRRRAIEKHLKELGYEPEFKFMQEIRYSPLRRAMRYTFKHHRRVAQAKELTPRVWATISGELVELMESFREQRIEELHVTAMKSRLNLIAIRVSSAATSDKSRPAYEYPTLADVISIPEFRVVLERPLGGAREDYADDVTIEDFKPAFAQFDQQVNKWAPRCKNTLSKLLPRRKGALSVTDPLHLATTLFECKYCVGKYSRGRRFNSALSFEEALKHRCYLRNNLSEIDDQLVRCVYSNYYTSPWNYYGMLAFDLKGSKTASQLLPLFGLDAKTATVEDTKALTVSLVCPECKDYPTKRYDPIYSWSRALSGDGMCFTHTDTKLVPQTEEKESDH